MSKYKIADYCLEVIGDDCYLWHRFKDFRCDDSIEPDMTVRFVEKCPLFPRFIWDKGTRIGIFHYYEDGDTVYQYFPYQRHLGVRLIEIKNDYRDFTYYLCDKKNSAYVTKMGQNEYLENMQMVIFNLLQESFYNMALFHGGFSIHSASVVYQDKAIVFSAPSGTGKSTQANMWVKHLGCEVLDGDVTMCRESEGKLYVHGLPWCGSSGQYKNTKKELGALVFLKQAKDNSVRVPTINEKVGYVYSSTFSELLNDEMAQKRAEMTSVIIEKGNILEFSCNMDAEAVEVLKSQIIY